MTESGQRLESEDNGEEQVNCEYAPEHSKIGLVVHKVGVTPRTCPVQFLRGLHSGEQHLGSVHADRDEADEGAQPKETPGPLKQCNSAQTKYTLDSKRFFSLANPLVKISIKNKRGPFDQTCSFVV